MIPVLPHPSLAEAHPCCLCLWRLFVSYLKKKTKMTFSSCWKCTDLLGNLLRFGFSCSVFTSPCPATCGLPQLCSNPLAGVFVEINASLILSGLLVEPFVTVRGVVTEKGLAESAQITSSKRLVNHFPIPPPTEPRSPGHRAEISGELPGLRLGQPRS